MDPQLAQGLDPSDARFWRRHLVAASALSVVCCACLLVYLLATWADRPNRTALTVLAVSAGALSALVPLLPTSRFMHGRARDAFFLGWSLILIALVTVLIELDGVETPIAGLYFLPLIFATMAYPFWPMVGVGAATVGCYLITAIAEGSQAGDIWIYTCLLTLAAAMCAWQSRLHGLQRAELSRLSRADPLTGCLNRRGLQERVDGELARATREAGPLSVVLIDLDGFKAVNDRDGHAAGDDLLCWTVERVTAVIRPMDALGRLGGDEFAVLLPGVDPDEAAEVAARLEAAIGERTSASTGCASFPADGVDAEELHAAADRRLYEAKRGRRDGSRLVSR